MSSGIIGVALDGAALLVLATAAKRRNHHLVSATFLVAAYAALAFGVIGWWPT